MVNPLHDTTLILHMHLNKQIHVVVNGRNLRNSSVCSPYKLACQQKALFPYNASVSADSMCESQMNMAALLKARSQGGVGRCNISSDCLALQCAGLQSYVLYSIGTRLLPCQTPFGVFVRVLARGITFINVVITQTTVFQFVNTVGVTATVRIEVEQKPFGMTIAVSLCAHTLSIIIIYSIFIRITGYQSISFHLGNC